MDKSIEIFLEDESQIGAIESLSLEDEALSPRQVRDRSDEYDNDDKEILHVQNDLKALSEKGFVNEPGFNRYRLTTKGKELARSLSKDDPTTSYLLNGGSYRRNNC